MFYQAYITGYNGEEVVDEGEDLVRLARSAKRCFGGCECPVLVRVRALCGKDHDRPHRGRSEARLWVIGPWFVVGGSGCVASALCAALDQADMTYCRLF